MIEWLNEWDLTQLQSIILGLWALCGDKDNVERNELIMKSMIDSDDWLIRSPFSIYIQRKWIQFLVYWQSDIGEWWLMIKYELDIPLLTEQGILIKGGAFSRVKIMHSSSMIDWLIRIKMLILLIDLFDRRVPSYERIGGLYKSQIPLVLILVLILSISSH